MSQRPLYYQSLLDSERITKAQYNELMRLWEAMGGDQTSHEMRLARTTPTELATQWQRRDQEDRAKAATAPPIRWDATASPGYVAPQPQPSPSSETGVGP